MNLLDIINNENLQESVDAKIANGVGTFTTKTRIHKIHKIESSNPSMMHAFCWYPRIVAVSGGLFAVCARQKLWFQRLYFITVRTYRRHLASENSETAGRQAVPR